MSTLWQWEGPPAPAHQQQHGHYPQQQLQQQCLHPAVTQQSAPAGQIYSQGAAFAATAAAAPPRPAAADGRLRSVEELPACFRAVFPFRYFNAIQNDCWPAIYEGGFNVVVAAPTGGGGCSHTDCTLLWAPSLGTSTHMPCLLCSPRL